MTAPGADHRRGAEPSSESAASLMLDILHGTVFHTISIISETLVFSSAASKLNYFVEHTSLVVSAPGRSVNSAIEMTVLLLLLLPPSRDVQFTRLPLPVSHGCQPDAGGRGADSPSQILQHELKGPSHLGPMVIHSFIHYHMESTPLVFR